MRVTNRVLATVVALVLLAASLVAIVEIVLAALGKQPWLVQHPDIAIDLHARKWNDGAVRLVAVLTAIAGILLLFVGLRRSARSELELRSDSDDVTVTVTRKSLQNYLAAIASDQPGVSNASAKTSRTRAVVHIDSPLRDPGDLLARVQAVVGERLQSLQLKTSLQPSVKIHSRES